MLKTGFGTLVLMVAAIAAISFGFTITADAASGARAVAKQEKKLTSSQAKRFVSQLRTELNIVLYDVINVPGVADQRDAFDKKFKARGSMKGKTKKQIAAMFMEDVNSSFNEPETRAEIQQHVDNLLAK